MPAECVVSADGTRIAYDITGSGPALMLLHGAGKTRRDWHKLGYVKLLQDDFRVITVDIRGTGESDRPREISDYGIAKIIQDIVSVADACDVQQLAVWGYSFGGNIARHLAARLERISRVVIVGVPLGPGGSDEFDA